MNIYESPDKGKTIYVRKFGSVERKKIPQTHQDMIDDGWTMTADGFWIKDD